MPIDKIQVCEVGDITGKPIQVRKRRKCKKSKCKTILNSYHYGEYCHAHERSETSKLAMSKYQMSLEEGRYH